MRPREFTRLTLPRPVAQWRSQKLEPRPPRPPSAEKPIAGGLLPLVEPPDHNRRGVSVQSTVANINGHGPFLEKFRTYRLKRAGVAFVLNGLE
ncbi:hypothetical protein AK812_SmicGene3511 [Symbiodinium microadriaticum]|uniref:Uncharacterized protein n=1 Tax=Symbiodinium microadriaticum TaxID=2951 RepID=A0A1Q9EYN3_SYMMI|nr:hypothetical protein AK812_SmicGene3511 [Symbiodinium microadriaticum]